MKPNSNVVIAAVVDSNPSEFSRLKPHGRSTPIGSR